MKERHALEIQVTPQNPVQYLACCGAFEILARFDDSATARWHNQAPAVFLIESQITQDEALRCFLDTLPVSERWESSTFCGEVVGVEVSFTAGGRIKAVYMDWWYESLNWNGRIEAKSAWKMYAGQQTAKSIIDEMVKAAASLAESAKPTSLSQLIALNCGMTGRLGLDPRSSRNALDAGYSANDLNIAVATYPFAELMAVIGVQHFFPHRTRQSARNDSTRGWAADNTFRYGLWVAPLSIALARAAASCAPIDDESRLLPMKSVRGSRDKYSNLRMAVQTNLAR
jgi:hypothetical protein